MTDRRCAYIDCERPVYGPFAVCETCREGHEPTRDREPLADDGRDYSSPRDFQRGYED